MASSERTFWNIARVPYKDTVSASEWLRERGIPVSIFTKRVPIRKRNPRQKTFKLEYKDAPILPGYVFFRTDNFDMIRAHGSIRPLVSGDYYLTIGDLELDGLRKEAGHKSHAPVKPRIAPKFTIGQKVEYKGAVCSVVELVEALQGVGLKIEMEMLGTKRLVDVTPQAALELSEVAA